MLEGSVLAEPLKDRRHQQSSMLLESGQAIRVDGIGRRSTSSRPAEMTLSTNWSSFARCGQFPSGIPARGRSWVQRIPIGGSPAEARGLVPIRPRRPSPMATLALTEDNRPDVSQWISVSKDGYPGVPPESVHTFETTLDLTGYDLDTVYIVGYFLVDDAINELRINGHPVDYRRWVTTSDVFDFRSFHPIEIVDHFVEGENVISIDIYNSPSRPEFSPDTPNPTALRVEWQAFGSLLAD